MEYTETFERSCRTIRHAITALQQLEIKLGPHAEIAMADYEPIVITHDPQGTAIITDRTSGDIDG